MDNTMNNFWGHHLILDCAGCIPHKIRCPNNINQFAKSLVKSIDMVAYGEPQVVMFGTGNKKGYTLVQLIETSNITAHFVEETNDIYIDVFSCKPFNEKDVDRVVLDFFGPLRQKSNYLVRQAPREQLR
jgi:S-adenosylmethionine/arginine decarboxylase-like enzyme